MSSPQEPAATQQPDVGRGSPRGVKAVLQRVRGSASPHALEPVLREFRARWPKGDVKLVEQA
ncbi:MAG TPA: hypothetical protein VM784_13080, partial [Actinomycetota bacterium]|nr:hypothetical protein [Actinomycetota bacterium]